ncbi:MAG TPA: UPF0158 family protein [Telluria sp.]
MPTVHLDDLENAMILVSDSSEGAEAWVQRSTGAVYVKSDLGDEEEQPDDLGTTDDYVEVPNQRDLDLGNAMAFAFTEAEMPQNYDRVREIFSKKGAYANFSRLLDASNARDKWHKFRDDQTRQALSDWCRENGLEPGKP